MRIVDRKTFLSLPANTLYRKYGRVYFGELEVKESDAGEWDSDWVASTFEGWVSGIDDSYELAAFLIKAESGDVDFRFDLNCSGRDGLFEDDQLFAIYDKEDVKQLIERLQGILDSQ